MSNDSSFPIQKLNDAQNAVKSSFAKLSSGVRITKAADDAAGLAIANALQADQVTLSQGSRNAQDGISINDIRDGALGQIGDITSRLQELATESSNGTLSDTQRSSLAQEFNALTQEANRIAGSTTFNGQSVLSSDDVSIQVGTDSSANSQINSGSADVAGALKTLSAADISTQAGAQSALSAVQDFGSQINQIRGNAGSAVARLDVAIQNNDVAKENLAAAESRIRDVDVAAETANLVKNQILTQTSTAVSAQANLNASVVLQLLK